MSRRKIHPNAGPIRTRLVNTFRQLRRLGYFAHANWKCCQGCACAALPAGTTQAVFYHSQDAEMLRDTGRVYLSWGGDLSTILLLLRANGLAAETPCDANARILITGMMP